MRSLRCVLALSFFIAPVTSALAQHQSVTDAESADLAGPVDSVSVAQSYTHIQWQQPSGPTLVLPVWCLECEFDPDGNQTKSGQIINGSFQGQIIRIVHDANGLTSDRFVEDASTGEAVRHEVVGPFGKTEQTLYEGGKVQWRQTFSYDQYGNMIDWLTFDRTGKQEARVHTNKEPDGTLKEKSAWGKDGQLNYQQTFDPETAVEHFTTFDHFGRVDLTWPAMAPQRTLSHSPVRLPRIYIPTEVYGLGQWNVWRLVLACGIPRSTQGHASGSPAMGAPEPNRHGPE